MVGNVQDALISFTISQIKVVHHVNATLQEVSILFVTRQLDNALAKSIQSAANATCVPQAITD